MLENGGKKIIERKLKGERGGSNDKERKREKAFSRKTSYSLCQCFGSKDPHSDIVDPDPKHCFV